MQLQETTLAECEQEHGALKAELDAARAGLDARLAQAREELDSLNRKRVNVGKAIPRPVFMRYEFIRKRLEHPVIVAVREGVCSGCNIAVPPQAFIDLQRGQQILSCPNCQRLIFWCEHFAGEQPAAAPATAAPAETPDEVPAP